MQAFGVRARLGDLIGVTSRNGILRYVAKARAHIYRVITGIKQPPNGFADGKVVNIHPHHRPANFFRWVN
jgi:hypothetical protein